MKAWSSNCLKYTQLQECCAQSFRSLKITMEKFGFSVQWSSKKNRVPHNGSWGKIPSAWIIIFFKGKERKKKRALWTGLEVEAENIQTCDVYREFCKLSICFPSAVQVVHQHTLATVYLMESFKEAWPWEQLLHLLFFNAAVRPQGQLLSGKSIPWQSSRDTVVLRRCWQTKRGKKPKPTLFYACIQPSNS